MENCKKQKWQTKYYKGKLWTEHYEKFRADKLSGTLDKLAKCPKDWSEEMRLAYPRWRQRIDNKKNYVARTENRDEATVSQLKEYNAEFESVWCNARTDGNDPTTIDFPADWCETKCNAYKNQFCPAAAARETKYGPIDKERSAAEADTVMQAEFKEHWDAVHATNEVVHTPAHWSNDYRMEYHKYQSLRAYHANK